MPEIMQVDVSYPRRLAELLEAAVKYIGLIAIISNRVEHLHLVADEVMPHV